MEKMNNLYPNESFLDDHSIKSINVNNTDENFHDNV